MRLFHFIFFFIMVLSSLLFAQEVRAKVPVNMKVDRLAAWCIVPFDAKRRGPEARAKMLARLGIKRCAYDWRGEHVKDFEEEILLFGLVMMRPTSCSKNITFIHRSGKRSVHRLRGRLRRWSR
jgi:hypothetical protein